MVLAKPLAETWCVMHGEPSYHCDYDFFPSKEAALHYAENVIGNAEDDGVVIRVFVMRVVWTSETNFRG